MRKKVLITSALPYANGPLHFGHIAGAYLPADCYARFERLQGHDVLYICGSDEYGVAITLSAELAGRTPKEHVDLFHAINRQFFHQLNISFDHYSRTTCEEHQEVVQQFFLDLLKNGYIEEKETEQLYSIADHKFLADRYVKGTCPRCGFLEARGDECGKCGASYEATDLKNPCSKLSGAPLEVKKTRHWFLLFDRFKEPLEKFLDAHPWKQNVLHFAKAYLEDLHPRAITRDLEWGIPVPLSEAKGKVFYVWFDAPIGYITATKEWAKKIKHSPEAWKDYWLDPHTKFVQFMGKDNIPFHAIFFPAMLMGQNVPYKRVDDLAANEFLNLEGKKFSKSDGWIIDLDDFFSRFHADQIRYTIAANAPETGDSEFTWKDFQSRCNAELLGKLGNLVNRVLVFLQNNCQGKVPPLGILQEIDQRFLNTISQLASEAEESYASYRLRRASQILMELAQVGNAYFDAKTPWKDAKIVSSHPQMLTTLALCLECIKTLALIAYPIIPATAERIGELLGFTKPLSHCVWKEVLSTPLLEGKVLPKPSILFQKIEDDVIELEIAKLKQMHASAEITKTTNAPPLKSPISLDQLRQIDLRVGQILRANKVPKSKKLLSLDVDIGIEVRHIISGIGHHYSPEELIGKKVVVVVNLETATIFGLQSQGMILAATLDSQVELATLQNLPVGAEIT